MALVFTYPVSNIRGISKKRIFAHRTKVVEGTVLYGSGYEDCPEGTEFTLLYCFLDTVSNKWVYGWGFWSIDDDYDQLHAYIFWCMAENTNMWFSPQNTIQHLEELQEIEKRKKVELPDYLEI